MKNSEQVIKRGKELLNRRKSKGFSRKEMSNMIGISDTAIANIENGITENISIELGKKFAVALGVSFNELFEIEGGSHSSEITNLINENEELKKQISKLLEEQLKDKKQLIDALKTHNLLERFALGLWGNSEEVEFVKMKAKEIEDSNESLKFQIESRPFDVNDTESMMKFIAEHFIWTPKK
ncbi:helix-turn-helix transcriptional regulator [Prolixibacteraceae bacterium Z1-6]|uniref:Helix-turn-helix transcriptional regulator n=1 Tax=Draconibacterium aestuarii TaxID=2998507 RepID=A0A9X3J6W1_9BACT|nr:helix-turn-helix transcriptional regulator [Prolixibacteraceae bacterium Z1-6]